MKISIHGGHNYIVPGASGIVNEVECDRKIVDKLFYTLSAEGVDVRDDTDVYGRTQAENLNNIVRAVNVGSMDLSLSIHLNSGGGHGVECLVYSKSSAAYPYAERICKELAKLGYRNRGVKERPTLAVLRRTKCPAVLVECGFVDSQEDCNRFDAAKIAQAIAAAVVGELTADKVYRVRVTAQRLNIRADHSASSTIRGVVEYGDVYTIVDEYTNSGTHWGKLKSGAGWICLDYTQKL